MSILLHFINMEYPGVRSEGNDVTLRLLERTNDPVEFIKLMESEF